DYYCASWDSGGAHGLF
nr:immunoglobulin light chain junction region [Macaca mulatta]